MVAIYKSLLYCRTQTYIFLHHLSGTMTQVNAIYVAKVMFMKKNYLFYRHKQHLQFNWERLGDRIMNHMRPNMADNRSFQVATSCPNKRRKTKKSGAQTAKFTRNCTLLLHISFRSFIFGCRYWPIRTSLSLLLSHRLVQC